MLVLWAIFCVLIVGLLVTGFLVWKDNLSQEPEMESTIVIRNSNPPAELVVNTIVAASKGDLQTIYEVKRGDSLWRISKKFGVTVSAIKAANKDRDDVMMVGEKLVIPARP